LEMAASENIPVGFYGGDADTLKKLVARMQASYPGLNVAYSFSPPFRALTYQENEDICQQIRSSGVRILFIGLGCPKQERWMAAHRGRIPAVMLGVGAAFDFHSGAVRQAPGWMQVSSLEWLYRFFQEPRRLWKRYVIHNPRFVILALAELLGIIRTPR
jgi:N-acetylglucosaminyldiphosphoundecaprenol N-acetyl-beta-D-mannosaminyltransferase